MNKLQKSYSLLFSDTSLYAIYWNIRWMMYWKLRRWIRMYPKSERVVSERFGMYHTLSFSRIHHLHDVSFDTLFYAMYQLYISLYIMYRDVHDVSGHWVMYNKDACIGTLSDVFETQTRCIGTLTNKSEMETWCIGTLKDVFKTETWCIWMQPNLRDFCNLKKSRIGPSSKCILTKEIIHRIWENYIKS